MGRTIALCETQEPSRKRRRVDDILDRLKGFHGLGYIEKERLQMASCTRNENCNNDIKALHEIAPPRNLYDEHNLKESTLRFLTIPLLVDQASLSVSANQSNTMDVTLPVDPSKHEASSVTAVDNQRQVATDTDRGPIRSLASRLACLGSKKELVWDPRDESLDDFLSVASPSSVWSPCEWIVVHNNNPDSPGFAPNPILSCNVTPIKKILKELETKVHADQTIFASEKNHAVQRILNIAQTQKFTLGKWILRFSLSDRLDEFWKRLAEHTANGNLGCSIKMAPSKYLRNEAYEKVLCCIFVKDFTDPAEVKRVWHALRKLGFGQFGATGFKPEIFSLCGISSGNSWGLSTVIHTFEEALSWEDIDERL
jgi:hypothetical protein